DTLEWITNLMAPSGGSKVEGKVLITSRQAFWDEFVGPTLQERFERFELLPFSTLQRKHYWENAFPSVDGGQKREHAEKIYARIQDQARAELGKQPPGEQLGAVPAILALIAECAEDDESSSGKFGKYLEDARPLDGLIKYLCAR